MAADLASIIAAARDEDGLVVSLHYLADRLGKSNRPALTDLAFGLREDTPRITRDEAGSGNDERGDICEIACFSRYGRAMTVRVNYAKRPMKVVTAFYI